MCLRKVLGHREVPEMLQGALAWILYVKIYWMTSAFFQNIFQNFS